MDPCANKITKPTSHFPSTFSLLFQLVHESLSTALPPFLYRAASSSPPRPCLSFSTTSSLPPRFLFSTASWDLVAPRRHDGDAVCLPLAGSVPTKLQVVKLDNGMSPLSSRQPDPVGRIVPELIGGGQILWLRVVPEPQTAGSSGGLRRPCPPDVPLAATTTIGGRGKGFQFFYFLWPVLKPVVGFELCATYNFGHNA